MHHIAIMRKAWKLIPKILSGEKTIESRWYLTRRAPWGKVKRGDVVFFRNGGEPVTAKAAVSEALHFEIRSLADAKRLARKYGKAICLVNRDPASWKPLPKYCILLRLRDPRPVRPFRVDKTGFGSATAWMCVDDIRDVRAV